MWKRGGGGVERRPSPLPSNLWLTGNLPGPHRQSGIRIRRPAVQMRDPDSDPDPFHNVTNPQFCFAIMFTTKAGLHSRRHVRLFILQGGRCERYVAKCDHCLAQRTAGGQAGLQVHSQGPLRQVGRRKLVDLGPHGSASFSPVPGSASQCGDPFYILPQIFNKGGQILYGMWSEHAWPSTYIGMTIWMFSSRIFQFCIFTFYGLKICGSGLIDKRTVCSGSESSCTNIRDMMIYLFSFILLIKLSHVLSYSIIGFTFFLLSVSPTQTTLPLCGKY